MTEIRLTDPAELAEPATPSCRIHPQTMCPAFGALRVLTRLDGAHPVMTTDTGCMYGLTYVTHFYGARKSILSHRLGTAELMAGNVMEGTLDAVKVAAAEPGCELVPVISLCVAETAGMVEEMLPKRVGNAEVVLVRVPAYAIHSHPEAKDIALAALLARMGDTNAPKQEKTVALLGEVFPADPLTISHLLRQMGVTDVIVLPGRAVGDLRRAAQTAALAPLHPFYTRTATLFRSWGTPVVGGAPVGISGSYAWLKALGSTLKLDPKLVEEVASTERARAEAIVAAKPIQGRLIVSGYEGTELAYARLLVEAGAEVPYVSTSIGQDPLVLPDELWLKKHGTRSIVYRKTLEDDVAAMDAYRPDLVFGTTPFANEAKARGIPAMYFTNQLAARPFFLSAGMAATVDFIRATLDGSPRYAWMEEFFRLSPSDAAEAA